MNEYIVSVDFGQFVDSTTIGTFQKTYEMVNGQALSFLDFIDLNKVDQMDYTEQARQIMRLISHVDLSGNSDLILDGGGVGAVVFDNLRDAGAEPMKIVSTSGNKVNEIITTNRSGFKVKHGWNVPKEELVDTLKIVFEQRRFRIAEGIPFEKDIRKQLAHYTGQMSKSKNMIYGNDKPENHDDIVTMIMQACWFFMQAEGARSDFRYKESEQFVRQNKSGIIRSADYDPFSCI